MKIRIETVEGLAEDEVLIRCGRMDDTIAKIHQYILEQTASGPKIVFYKKNQTYFFPIDDVLFFETDGERVFAHTKNDAYLIKHRLYELEGRLPQEFVRIAKSTIVNSRHVFSIARNLTASSLVQFNGTHKQVYASRHYYQALKQRLNERSQS